ncbi:alpha/beta hydrolase [Pontibacillus salicampi]|uniref:Alpha/beta hydrolase n=1 Tax=Pontibacillus salicampi TaxID=1449801 RepID=A0ABV6LPT2_9BACI
MYKVGGVMIVAVLLLLGGCNALENDSNSLEKDISGYWNGAIEIPGSPLPIEVELEQEEDLTGTIHIPSQNIDSYPLSSITIKEEHASFTMDIQGQMLRFEGKVQESQWSGTFTQQGQSFPFTLTKGTKPQAKEEFGVEEQVETTKGPLYGNLATPENKDTFPVVLIIPGSGPTDRNGNSSLAGNNDSLKLLAKELAQQGIASLRYDKRGVGKNANASIPEEEMTFGQFAADATHWLELLKADDRFTQVGVIGHSQGSLVGMLAAQEENIEVFISIAGASEPIGEVLLSQLEPQVSDDMLNKAEQLVESLKKGETVQDVPSELASVFRPSIQSFMSSWMAYKPKEEIKKLDIPILAVGGTTDLQVPATSAEALHEASDNSELLIVNEMNHVLKKAPRNREENVKTYNDPALPLADGLMEGILEFLEQQQFVDH